MLPIASLGRLQSLHKQPRPRPPHRSDLLMQSRLASLVAVIIGLSVGSSAPAQGLIWAIPAAEGQWVRYEGQYRQVIKRPNDPRGDLALQWTRHLTIKSLHSEMAEFQGRSVNCRWIELKVITGPVKEGIIDAGPGGIRLYKVLVPIEAIEKVAIQPDGAVLDANGVLATYVPIVKGYRKVGNESAATIETGVLDVFPVLAMVQHYRQLSQVGEEDVSLRNETVPTEHWRGEMITEDPFTRSTSTGDLWRCKTPAVPFGIAKWTVTFSVEGKASTEPRSAFALVSELTEEMSAAEIGDAAESELVVD